MRSKSLTYLTLLMTAVLTVLLSVACSADDASPAEGTAGSGTARSTGVTDSLWFNLRIVTPGSSIMTRAPHQNDHGSVEEYEVKTGILVLLKGTEESDAKVWQSYDITETFKEDGLNSITQSTHIIKSVTTGNTSDKLFALVLLNVKNEFKVSGTALQRWDGSAWADVPSDSKLNYFKTLKLNALKNDDGFFMSNAPVSDGTSVTTLVEVTNVFMTELQAKNSDATNLMVERAAAKITVYNAVSTQTAEINFKTGIIIDDIDDDNLKVNTMHWAVDKYNATGFAVRSTTTATPYDNDNIIDGKGRALWAKDAQWNTDITATPLASLSFLTSGSVAYVGEHAVEDANKNYATRIIVKLTFKDASNIIISKEGKSLYGNTGATDRIFTTEAKRDAYVTAHSLDVSNNIEYSDGVMYFSYPIRHEGTSYAVVRDNTYPITLKEIKAISTFQPEEI